MACTKYKQLSIVGLGLLVCFLGVARSQEETAEPPESGVKLDINYVPTPQAVVDLMLEMAQVKSTDLLYDLGCGDGRIVVTAGKKFGCKAVGVDLDPVRVRESQENVRAAQVEDLVTIEQRNIFDIDLSDVDVVTMYLHPALNLQLVPQLKQMKPGSRIVSHDFNMPYPPEASVTYFSREDGEHRIFLWTLPLPEATDFDDDAATVAKRDPGADAETPQPRRGGLLGSPAAARTALIAIACASLGVAALFWLLRKKLGTVRFHVTFDRPSR